MLITSVLARQLSGTDRPWRHAGCKPKELCDQLSKLKGAGFDRAYSRDMVSGHEKAIERFEAEAKNGQDPAVKAWAEKWLPTLREHLKVALAPEYRDRRMARVIDSIRGGGVRQKRAHLRKRRQATIGERGA